MSSVNLNRQKKLNEQMKEVMDDFDRFEYFFASNWKRIVYASVLVIVVVAVVVSIKYFANKSSMAASAAYSKAVSCEELEAALQKYPSAPAAVNIRLAGMYIEKKDYAKARKQLEIAVADSKTPETQWRARLNLAYLAELEGKYVDAAKQFADLAKTLRGTGSAGYAAEAYIAAGRLYTLAGDQAAAKAILTAGKSFMSGVASEERPALQGFEGMLNTMLANSAK